MSGDYDFEPVRGLPAHLPKSETLLWQGHPEWRSLAVHAFHVRKVVVYFVLLAVWSVASTLADGNSMGAALSSVVWVAPMALAAVALLSALNTARSALPRPTFLKETDWSSSAGENEMRSLSPPVSFSNETSSCR